MAIERIELSNYAAYGELIKKWANDAGTRPGTIQELIDQTVAAGVGMTIPSRLQTLEFVEHEHSVMKIVIPIPQMVAESETRLLTDSYRLPDFYDDLAFHTPANVSDDDKLTFHNSRIGDYTTSQCA